MVIPAFERRPETITYEDYQEELAAEGARPVDQELIDVLGYDPSKKTPLEWQKELGDWD